MAPVRSPEAWLGDLPRFTHEGVGRRPSGEWDRPKLVHQGVTEIQERRGSWRPIPFGCFQFERDIEPWNLRNRGSWMFRASPTREWDGVFLRRNVDRVSLT